MFGLGTLHSFAIAVVVAVVLIGLLTDWFRKAAAKRHLEGRQPFNDEEFQRTFYASDKQLADTATRVRRVLSRNLDMPLESVRPEDRLDDDLNARLAANPLLFAELEDEFDISTGYDDLDTFEKTAARLDTFSDLVVYVRDKLGQTSRSDRNRNVPITRLERIVGALDEIVAPAACFVGLTIAVAGGVLRIDAAWRIGSGMFMLGIAYFVVSFLIGGIANLTTEVREQGTTWIKEHPIRAAWVGIIVAAMVYMSIELMWFVLRMFTSPN
jgi:hypothetical protein